MEEYLSDHDIEYHLDNGKIILTNVVLFKEYCPFLSKKSNDCLMGKNNDLIFKLNQCGYKFVFILTHGMGFIEFYIENKGFSFNLEFDYNFELFCNFYNYNSIFGHKVFNFPLRCVLIRHKYKDYRFDLYANLINIYYDNLLRKSFTNIHTFIDYLHNNIPECIVCNDIKIALKDN